MVDSQHVLTVVWKQVGLDTITSGVQNLEKTSQTAAKSQDTLSKSLTGTSKSASTAEKSIDSTGKSLDNTSKSAKTTTKETQTLGQAFKGSALLIAGFASSLVNTYMQYDRVADQSMRINKMRAQLDSQTNALQLREIALEKSYAAGNMTSEQYRLATEKLAAQREKLSVQEQIYTDAVSDQQAAMLQLATSVIPTVATGWTSIQNILSSLKSTHDAAKVSQDALTTAVTAGGTAASTAVTTGINPLMSAFQSLTPPMTETLDTIGTTTSTGLTGALANMGTEMTNSEKSGNVLVKLFKNMGNSIVIFFTNLKKNITSIPDLFTGIGTTVKDFFVKIKDGFVSFGTHIVDAIKSLGNLRAASIITFLTNPAFIAIAAISAGIVALSGNIFGVRDAVNGMGVALGNAVPALKGILTSIGDMANSALDAIGNFLGFKQQIDSTGQSAVENAKKYGTLALAIQNVLHTMTTQEIDAMITAFANMRSEIDNLGKTGLVGIRNLKTEISAFHEKIGEQSPKSEQLFKNFNKVLEESAADGIITVKELNNIGAALTELGNSLGNTIDVENKAVEAQTGVTDSTKEMGDTYNSVRKYIDDFFEGIKIGEANYNDFVLGVVTGNDELIASLGLSNEEMQVYLERFTKDFPEGARVVEVNGKKIIVSIKDIQDQAASMTKDIESMVDTIVKGVGEHIPPTFQQAESAVAKMRTETAYMAEVHEAAAAGIINDDNKLKEVVNELAVKYFPFLGKSATDVLADIQKETENQTKEQDKANKKIDEAIEKSKALAQTRQEEIQADRALATEATKLLTTMGEQIRVTDMTGKGLQSLITIYDDTTNATKIAADAVGLWYAELEKTDAVNKATLPKLFELAQSLGIEIPQAILDKGIPAIKDYIEQVQGIGDAAKKAADEATNAFDSLVGKANDAMADLIQEDVVKGDGDEVIEKLEEIGVSITDLTALPAIIKPFLDDTDLTDDLVGLQDILNQTWAQAELQAKGGGQKIVEALGDSIIDTLGPEIGIPIVENLNKVWETIEASDGPTKAGSVNIQQLFAALNKPSELAAILGGVAQAGANGFISSGHLFATAGEKAMYELMKMWDPAGAEAYAKGLETGAKGATGTAAGIKNNSGTPAEEMRNMGVLMVGQLNMILDDEVNTTLPGYIAMFATKFTEMGNTAANIAIAAQTHFKTVDDALLLMQTNLTSFYNVWDKIMKDAGTSLQTLADDSKIKFDEIDKAIQLTETNVSSLYKVWDAAMKEMITKVGDFAKACETSFGNVKKDADTATKAVEALQKAIDALKDKEVKITYRIETVGSPPKGARFGGSLITPGYAQHGGAWIQNKPKNIGGMNVSEFSKPELITATPLSNPYNTMDKSISLPSIAAAGGGRGGGGQPITVSGDLSVIVTLPDGKALAKEVRRYILEGFSGIT